MPSMFRCSAALALALAVPSVAHARREPSPTDAGAPIPVGPAAAPAPIAAAPAAEPAPAIAAPTIAAPAPAPAAWQPAPTPPPVVQAPAVPPPRLVGPPPPRVRVTEGNDLIAAGLASFGGFYFFTSLAGAVIIDKARDRNEIDAYTGEKRELDTRRLNYGRALLVPVAGPFIGLAYTSSAKERWAAALTGAVQVTGVVLTMVGLTQKARARRAQRYSVGAGVGAGTAMLSLHGRF